VVLLLIATGAFASGFTGKVLGMGTKLYNDSSAQSNSEKKNLKEMYDFDLEWDKTMAKAFNIDLSGYRKIDTMVGLMKPEHKELNIGDIREQITLKYGDKVPSIYLNKSNTQGIAVTQDLRGSRAQSRYQIGIQHA